MEDSPQSPPTDIDMVSEGTPLLAGGRASHHHHHTETPVGGRASLHHHHHPPSLGSSHVGDHHTAHDHTSKQFHMHLLPTVYCTILYAPSICRLRTGNEIGRPTRLALALVTLNMILQVGMLRIMDVYGHRDAEASFAGIMEYEQRDHVAEALKETYAAFLSPPEREVLEQADRLKPLCTVYNNGTYSCKPPSVAFVSRWNLLDTNGDGEWTMAEAAAAEEKITKKSKHGKKSNSDHDHWILKRPTLIFNSIVNGLKQRAAVLENQNQLNGTSLFLSENLKGRHAISKAYFDYWAGDAMMCTRFDRSTCQHVVASGLFDAALTDGPIAAALKGIFDYDSAIRHCQFMLEVGGGCEESLPVSYMENVASRRTMCGVIALGAQGGMESMTNPVDETEKFPVMRPSFSMLQQQKRAVDSMFLFFKILIMYLFYASILQEIRELMGTLEFLVRFPGLRHAADPGGLILDEDKQGPEEKKYRITGISRKHRGILVIIFILRVFILAILVRFGSWFLLNEGRYIELVMNALALSFITGIDEMMYSFMEASEIREDGYEDVETLNFESIIPHHTNWIGYIFRKDCWGLFIIPIISIAVVLWNAHYIRMPRIEAMNCACLSEGDHCAESMVNQGAWWQNYWSHILPAAVHQIEALRLESSF